MCVRKIFVKNKGRTAIKKSSMRGPNINNIKMEGLRRLEDLKVVSSKDCSQHLHTKKEFASFSGIDK